MTSVRSKAAALVVASVVVVGPTASATPAQPRPLVLTPLETESKGKPSTPIADLKQDVAAHPDDRGKRVALVRGLLRSKDLDGALAEAKAWRAKDAYSLVAVRALGDVYMERGEKANAERVYSAIVELLPRDTDAQRALATLLKQRGDLPAAEDRLRAALETRPEDSRLSFELADVEQRLGKNEPAAERLAKVIDDKETNEQIRHPAKLRLAQLLAADRRAAASLGDGAKAATLGARIAGLGLEGGLENDLHVYLTWDTNRTDVDLWVTTPSGEKVYYQHRAGAGGEALFDDVTNGYGPESFTAKTAAAGEYVVQVNYFSGHGGPFPEARGEVIVVLDEGRPTERKTVLPYRIFDEKDTVSVARIKVGGA